MSMTSRMPYRPNELEKIRLNSTATHPISRAVVISIASRSDRLRSPVTARAVKKMKRKGYKRYHREQCVSCFQAFPNEHGHRPFLRFQRLYHRCGGLVERSVHTERSGQRSNRPVDAVDLASAACPYIRQHGRDVAGGQPAYFQQACPLAAVERQSGTGENGRRLLMQRFHQLAGLRMGRKLSVADSVQRGKRIDHGIEQQLAVNAVFHIVRQKSGDSCLVRGLLPHPSQLRRAAGGRRFVRRAVMELPETGMDHRPGVFPHRSFARHARIESDIGKRLIQALHMSDSVLKAQHGVLRAGQQGQPAKQRRVKRRLLDAEDEPAGLHSISAAAAVAGILQRCRFDGDGEFPFMRLERDSVLPQRLGMPPRADERAHILSRQRQARRVEKSDRACSYDRYFHGFIPPSAIVPDPDGASIRGSKKNGPSG
ncbi:hypothetical protein BN871_AI_01520 [Paenibacillus sp. P22]|nr:hypothetical protein BN871_AI_01520 [Paenibacillus sp. P22]